MFGHHQFIEDETFGICLFTHQTVYCHDWSSLHECDPEFHQSNTWLAAEWEKCIFEPQERFFRVWNVSHNWFFKQDILYKKFLSPAFHIKDILRLGRNDQERFFSGTSKNSSVVILWTLSHNCPFLLTTAKSLSYGNEWSLIGKYCSVVCIIT